MNKLLEKLKHIGLEPSKDKLLCFLISNIKNCFNAEIPESYEIFSTSNITNEKLPF